MILRLAGRCLFTLVIAAVLLYIADSVLWQLKLMHGRGFQSVEVNRVSVAPLKGNKEEYYFDGKDTVQCTVSYAPMITSKGIFQPCWYLQKHRLERTDY
jgi:hypothetical protein